MYKYSQFLIVLYILNFSPCYGYIYSSFTHLPHVRALLQLH